ncbi:MAG: prephenate dehydrogenase, partial [Clostridia bacterium]|nr:prephenate dehydrogenase [Clostridia bacterium]
MTLPKETKILIVGLGLIGGSYARALTKRGYAVRAITLEQSSVDFAKNAGIVADAAAEIRTDWIRDADLIVFALYPHIFVEWIEEHGHLLTPGTVVTDVTGVKTAIIGRIQEMIPDGVEFIAAHPMAGREVYGVENSDDGIFRGANYIVTPTEKNTPDAIALCRSLG